MRVLFRRAAVIAGAVAVVLGSAGTGVGMAAATAGQAGTPTASQQLCQSYGGTYSTKASSSIFAPAYKGQGVLWTCNGYSGGSSSSQALVQSCLVTDGGQGVSSADGPPGYATCWEHPFTTGSPSEQLCQSYGGTYSTKASSSVFAPSYKKQGVLWTCNGYGGGSSSSQALVQECLTNAGGQGATSTDGPPGDVTCWKNPFS